MRSGFLLLFVDPTTQVAYSGTSFAGYVGLWTGQSPNKFTVSGDQRGEAKFLLCSPVCPQVFRLSDLTCSHARLCSSGTEHWWNWWKNLVSAFLFRRSPVSWLVREVSISHELVLWGYLLFWGSETRLIGRDLCRHWRKQRTFKMQWCVCPKSPSSPECITLSVGCEQGKGPSSPGTGRAPRISGHWTLWMEGRQNKKLT